MEFLQGWLPLFLAVVALVVAFLGNRRENPSTIHLEGVLDEAEEILGEGAEIISAGAEFVAEMTPAAITIVKGLRQLYLNGEVELDQLKPMAVEQMQSLFPDAEPERLEIVVEGAVFGVKMVAKELWKRAQPPTQDSETSEGESEGIGPTDGEVEL